jgi:hypothetical protein
MSFLALLLQAGKAVLKIVAVQVLTNALSGQKHPKTQAQEYPLNQSVVPALNFVGGYSKTGGAYVFREARGDLFATIQAISYDRLDSFESFWLAGDKVTIDGSGVVTSVSNGGTAITDGRYTDSPAKCYILTRLGAATETAYSEVTSAFSDLWDSSCRGDGIGSMCVLRYAGNTKYQPKIWPNGAPEATCSARGVCYDWRYDSTAGGSGSQRRDDDTTWQWSANPIVWLVHKEWTAWGRDWDEEIAPVLSDLTDEADCCDEGVSKYGGGTEPRYRVAFNYFDDEDIATTRTRILDAMDGYYTDDGLGRLVVKAGRYDDPTFTVTDDDIRSLDNDAGYSWRRGVANADAVDLINITFVSPENDYKDAQCDPWIIQTGRRAFDLKLEGVTSWRQARRLAKRKAAKLMPTYTGWVRVGWMGRDGLGERFIRIQNPRQDSMADVVCEVTGVEFDPETLTFVYSVISAVSNIDDWNPATEEGTAVGTVAGSGYEALSTPTIDDATAVFNDPTTCTISIDASGPSRSDITWSGRWQVTGDATWSEFTDTSVTGGSVTITTGIVPVNASIDVEVSYRAGSTPSDWSTATTVSTSAAAVAPAAPTSLTLDASTAGQVVATWHNPTSSNFYGTRLWRAAHSAGFGSATDVSGLKTGAANSTGSYTNTGIAAGAYDFWVTAENSSGAQSSPYGPVTATVT